MRIVIRKDDKLIRARAKQLGATVDVADGWEVKGPTLFANAPIPWTLVPAGFEYLKRWDVAVPLWRYGVLAESLGSDAERARTRKIVRDLRIPVYGCELLFVADTELGRALVETWRRECAPPESTPWTGGTLDERLAFLRSFFLVKPRLCALPRSWLVEEYATKIERRSMRVKLQVLTTVQIGPNTFVKCKLATRMR
jgi:hypothetical protein